MNLLVLCTDTFRADYLGCYGNGWIETPYLDEMAKEGVLFSDFYAEGLPTLPARRAFYTGRRVFPFAYYPQKGDGVQLPGWHPLWDDDITLAEWLGERGYTTGLISDVYHQMKPGKNFHRGFHSWQWIRGQEWDPLVPTPVCDIDVSRYVKADTAPDSPKRRLVAQYLHNRAWWKSEADHFAAQVMRAAATWLRTYGHIKPWMLWVECFDPHEPWDAPPEFVDKYYPNYEGLEPLLPTGSMKDYTEAEFRRIKAGYAGECTHVDKWCGYVLETLDGLGMRDDTMVVFTSDHGTMMGEQGQIHKGVDRVRIQVSRCPLIIRHPDRRYAGQVVEGFVQHHDLMPTLLRWLEQPVPERCNGEDFWPLVTGKGSGGLRDMVVSGFGWYAAVRTKNWTYHAPWFKPKDQKVHPSELYDRNNDPAELVNVIDQYPDIAQELQAHLNVLVKDFRPLGTEWADSQTPAAVPGVKW